VGRHAGFDVLHCHNYQGSGVARAGSLVVVQAIGRLREALDLARQMHLPGEEWQIAAELAASYTANEDRAAVHFLFFTATDSLMLASAQRFPLGSSRQRVDKLIALE